MSTVSVQSSPARINTLDPRATERHRNYFRCGFRHGADARAGAAAGAATLRRSIAQMFEMPEEQAVRWVVEDYRRRLDALPSAAKYPELRGMRECVMAYNGGVAEGSGLGQEDVIVRVNYLHTATAASRTRGRADAPRPDSPPGCTLVYFPESDRGPLVANNNDGTINFAHRNEPEWIVANRAGLIIGTVSSGIFDDEVSPEQFPAPVFLMLDEMCGTTSEAVDLATRLNLFWGPCNALFADRRGDSAIVEKSTCRFGVRRSADGFIATTEMSAEEPTFRSYLWETRERSIKNRGLTHDSADWAYWKAAERRSARLHRLVEEAKHVPSFAKMNQIIYDHTGEPEQVHMDGSKCHPDQEAAEWSLRTTVWVIDEHAAQFSFAEPPVSSHLTERHWKQYGNVDVVF